MSENCINNVSRMLKSGIRAAFLPFVHLIGKRLFFNNVFLMLCEKWAIFTAKSDKNTRYENRCSTKTCNGRRQPSLRSRKRKMNIAFC